jgi:hypothetical protein
MPVQAEELRLVRLPISPSLASVAFTEAGLMVSFRMPECQWSYGPIYLSAGGRCLVVYFPPPAGAYVDTYIRTLYTYIKCRHQRVLALAANKSLQDKITVGYTAVLTGAGRVHGRDDRCEGLDW